MSAKTKQSTSTKKPIEGKVQNLKKKSTPNNRKDGKTFSGVVNDNMKDVKAPAWNGKPKNANKKSRGIAGKVEKDLPSRKATTLVNRKPATGQRKDTKKDVKALAKKGKPKNASEKSRGIAAKVEKDSPSRKATTLVNRKPATGQRDKRSVYLKRVIASAKEQDIVDLFSRFGQIVTVRFLRRHSSAIVLFENETSVQKLVAKGHMRLKGNLVKIFPSSPSPHKRNGSRKKKTKETKVEANKTDVKKEKKTEVETNKKDVKKEKQDASKEIKT